MAIGTQFSVLRTRLRAELRRSTDVAVGVEDVPSLDVTLNHTYSALYLQRDWAHLRKVWSLSLAAGQRYYDFPSGLEPDRVEAVSVEWASEPMDLHKGIGFEQMIEFDSDDDERFEPAMRWDVRWTGTSTQIEIWPIPSTNTQTVRFRGIQAIARLVDDEDLCLLDDDLIVLFSAAELATGEDKETKLALAQSHLAALTRRMRGAERPFRLGLEGPDIHKPRPVTVRIAGA
jgi:hypothetical protein